MIFAIISSGAILDFMWNKKKQISVYEHGSPKNVEKTADKPMTTTDPSIYF